MDIKHLEYFIEVVHSGCNLSLASKKLRISQPALSYIIKTFELGESILLFERYNGRLQNLTPRGEIFYKNAMILIEDYQSMIYELRENSSNYKGKIRIGIPPFVLTALFTDIMPSLILDNPDIEFDIVEMGAFELRKSLVSRDLDFAVLLQPTDLMSDIVNTYELHTSELTSFMSINNPLAKNEKLNWQQLNGHPIAIFGNTFMIHHQLMKKFKFEDIKPKIKIVSSCWDYLLLSAKNSDLVTILPNVVKNIFNTVDVVEIPFHNPIVWQVVFCRPQKKRYSNIEKYVLNTILDHFKSTAEGR